MTPMTPDETAEAILRGDLVRRSISFLDFRFAMIDQHPDPLTDQEIHDLYKKHVLHPLANPDSVAILQAIGHMDDEGMFTKRALKKMDPATAREAIRRGMVVEPLKVREPKYDTHGGSILDVTIGEVFGKVGRATRALVRNVVASQRVRSDDDSAPRDA